MKKIIAFALSAVMALTLLAGCAPGSEPTVPTTDDIQSGEITVPEFTAPLLGDETEPSAPAADASTLEGIIEGIYAEAPVEFMVGNIPVDLTDTSEDGLWALETYTGLNSAEDITEAVVSEAMVGSLAYSMVLVRVADAANAQNVAEAMKSGIDQRKWICVEADDLMVAGSGDVVMLVMIASENGSAQTFVDAFASVMGGTDFTA